MASSAQQVNKNDLVQAQCHVFNNICAFLSSMSLKCAVELGIPDIIHKHGKPITLVELSEALSLPPSRTESAYRLMRLLVNSGIFATQNIGENQEEEGYVLTLSSSFLTTDTEYTLAPFVVNLLNPAQVKPGHIFSEWYRGTAPTAFEADQGMPFWNYLAQNPEYEKRFGATMAKNSHLVMTSIVKEHKEVLENLKSLVDCMVLDLPTLIANIPGTDNLEFIGGNMFEAIPPADAVLLKNTLHNWGDEEGLMILKSCRKAITTKVIIIDIVVKEGKKQENDEFSKTQLYFDMLMMSTHNGKERTEKQWEKLFVDSGFTHYKITPLMGFSSLIEMRYTCQFDVTKSRSPQNLWLSSQDTLGVWVVSRAARLLLIFEFQSHQSCLFLVGMIGASHTIHLIAIAWRRSLKNSIVKTLHNKVISFYPSDTERVGAAGLQIVDTYCQ
ncbi:hypothetical protein MKW98_007656 [Papaver atlanticum]|uniref:Uncharacterized protein n=1 Tax=Papaver atlanticum TaxID=357466 RepID=A0AAD4S3F8_9MAGN|nr:hypothetical protein MKW98_007656 [Papaver atlanticum]